MKSISNNYDIQGKNGLWNKQQDLNDDITDKA